MTKPPTRHLPMLIVLAAIGAAAGFYFGATWTSRPNAQSGPTDGSAEVAVSGTTVASGLSAGTLLYPRPKVLAPFTLRAADGNILTNATLQGRWTLAFFGFTHCPDVCPTALATMKQLEVLDRARTSAPALAYLFVSVDPVRDTPDVLREYAAYFSPSIIAATASPVDVETFASDVGVVSMQVPQEGGSYTIDHSTQMLLFNPDGNLRAIMRPPHVPAAMHRDIVRIAAAHRSVRKSG